MRRMVACAGFAAALCVLLCAARPAFAVEHKYIESFSTSAYKDAANTTAWWDTGTGELKVYPFALALLGTCGTSGDANSVVVSGDLAYVAAASYGLRVIDISDPASPTIVGTRDTPGIAQGIDVSGDHAYMADYASGLQVIDISDPTNPIIVGAYNTAGYAMNVAVAGGYAYVADFSSGLQVIDVSNPAAPTLAGTYNTPGFAWGVTVAGDHAFIADYATGLLVIDVSNPASPTLTGTCNTPGSALGVTVSGDRAYVADYDYGLQVIDITNLAAPTLVGSYNTVGIAMGVAVSGTRAYVADEAAGLHVIDITHPASPTLAGSLNTAGSSFGVAVSGNKAYVADGSAGLWIIEIAEPAQPTIVGYYHTGSVGLSMELTVSGHYVCIAGELSSPALIDITDPLNPAIVGLFGASGAMAISGDYVYIADHASHLYVYDISVPATPTVVGSCATPGDPLHVAVSGNHAFVADGLAGLQVIDISNPAAPTIVGTYNSPDWANSVAISGDLAFVSDYSSLLAIDISNPASPGILDSYSIPSGALGVDVAGDYAFVAALDSGLLVIDISDPTNLVLSGSCATTDAAYNVAVSGDYALMADYHGGIQMIDISDPANPTLTRSCDTPGLAMSVGISGAYACVADAPYGLKVIQVFQSEIDQDRNIGQSLVLDASSEAICKARLAASQSDSIMWELSADGGANWQLYAADGSWGKLAVPGSDLLWRSTLAWAAPGVKPTATQLEIEWLFESASIDSIVDVPDDQGGWVMTHFTRSAFDFPDELLPIASYGIWRRVDSAALLATLERDGSSGAEKGAAGDVPHLADIPFVIYQGATYVQSRPGLAAASFPPGTWAWVGTVPAAQQDAYLAVLPTAANSSATVFVLTAHTTTPSVWYVSAPDSGYSIDNIAPGVPTGFTIAYNTGTGNELSWDPSPDEDFQYFNVYRSNDPSFILSPSNLAHSTAETSWSDPEHSGSGVYYKITALDHAGNESEPASPETVTAADEPAIPQMYALYPNVPNPFNPSTAIRYDVPVGGGAVTLRVYDVSGRLVRTLVEGAQTAGQKAAVWNGKDDEGRSVASGVYFYRLQAPGYTKTLKMVLMK